MELFEALARKRACRTFSKELVPADLVRQLIYAFTRAPTASNRPYRHCIVIDDANVIRAVRRVSPSLLADPPLLFIVFTDLEVALHRTGKVAEFSSLVDSGAAGENVLLAATALGLGSQFTMISTTVVAPSPIARMPMTPRLKAGAFLIARTAKRRSASIPENAPAIRFTSGSRGC